MAGELRRVDPTKGPGWFGRTLARASNNRVGRWLSRTISWRLDPWLLRVSGGRLRSSMGIPTMRLGTTGARSGRSRANAVIYFHDGDDVIVVASQAGAATNPAWFHNLVAHPEVTANGTPMRATVVRDPGERARLWPLADNIFPVFADYRRTAAEAGRAIPIVRLTPSS